jgi:filamentous hemagglutinin
MTFPRKHPSFPQHIGTGPRAALTTAMGAVLGFLTPLPLHAGDVLRGGTVAGVRRSGTPDSGPNQAVIELARTNARDSLARSTRTIQAVRAMQQAARELAQRGPASLGKNPNQPTLQLSTVTDGLGPRGLQPVTNNPLLWKGAAQPRQSLQNGKTHVVVTQNQQQAVLTWDRFNVGKNTTLTFDQSKGGKGVRQWVALNKINDPSGEPSQILGKIQAPGQVYVINQNGILFGGSAQVNTHTLVASSLPINDNLVSRGLLSNPDAQFLFSGLEIPALANNATMPSFKPPTPPNLKT